jgi:hypothetical protein
MLKEIKDFPGYFVDKEGQVYSNRRSQTGKLKRLKLYKDRYGYLLTQLFYKKQRKCVLVHRLVSKYFIPNPLNKKCVNHKNGIKTDNRVENLEWVSYSENMYHAYAVLNRPKRK